MCCVELRRRVHISVCYCCCSRPAKLPLPQQHFRRYVETVAQDAVSSVLPRFFSNFYKYSGRSRATMCRFGHGCDRKNFTPFLRGPRARSIQIEMATRKNLADGSCLRDWCSFQTRCCTCVAKNRMISCTGGGPPTMVSAADARE